MGRRKIKNPPLESAIQIIGMEESEALLAFETLAKTLDVDVRYEKGDFRSGLYRLYEKHVILMQKDIPDIKKIEILARDLSAFDLEKIYILPQLLAIMKQVQTGSVAEEPILLEDK